MISPVDFGALYDAHPEYVARRRVCSFEQAQIDIEVMLFKMPQLLTVWPEARAARSTLEIGCATGELLAAMPIAEGGRKVGIDISASNVAVAAERHPGIEFRCCDFRTQASETFDIVILSDVLEHVPDDREFLRDAAALADVVLLNLPLEDNWLNSGRRYGPDDVSGHLRRYCLADGFALVAAAGLEVLGQNRAWVHESPAAAAQGTPT